MITQIFNYIQGIITELDSELLLLDDPFGDDDYSSTNEVEDGYKIIPGPAALIKESSFFTRTIPVTIEISRKAYRDIIEDYQPFYDFALSIEGELVSPQRLSAENFSNVLSLGVTPSPFDRNDRTLKMRIAVNFTTYLDCD